MTELKDLRHQRNPRALNPPDRTGLRNLCELVQSVGLKKNKLLIRTTTSAERYSNEEKNSNIPMNKEERNSFRKEMIGKLEEQWAKSNSPEDQAYDLLDDIDFYYNNKVKCRKIEKLLPVLNKLVIEEQKFL